MGPAVLTDPGEVPLYALEQIDRICLRFEQGWQSGPKAALRPLLAEVADQWRPALFRELVRVELDYRENPRLDEYVETYPEFADWCARFSRSCQRLKRPPRLEPDPRGRFRADEPAAASGKLPDPA